MGSAVSQRIGGNPALPGVAMRSESLNPVVSVHSRDKYQAPLPTRTRVRPMTRAAIAESVPKHPLPDRPRVVRMPSDWWDAPSVVALALTPGPQPAKTARRFTRSTLGRWGLDPLADDAEVIVAELVANALCHAMRPPPAATVIPSAATPGSACGFSAAPARSCAPSWTPATPLPYSARPITKPNAAGASSWWTRSVTCGDGAPSPGAARPSGPFSSAPEHLSSRPEAPFFWPASARLRRGAAAPPGFVR